MVLWAVYMVAAEDDSEWWHINAPLPSRRFVVLAMYGWSRMLRET